MRSCLRTARAQHIRASDPVCGVVALYVFVAIAVFHAGTWFYWMAALFHGHWFSSLDIDSVFHHLRLAQILVACSGLWAVLLWRRVLTPETGYGILLAAFGYHAQVLAHFVLDMTPEWTAPVIRDIVRARRGTEYYVLIPLVQTLGAIAFWSGLCLVPLAAILTRRR
jgi:hypothetical protein